MSVGNGVLHTGIRSDICSLLQVGEHEDLGTYLGLPMSIGRNKKEVLGYVRDRVWKKLNSWKARKLSKSGKEILLKMVLQAILNYVTMLFLFPKSLCEELEKIMCRFWWGKTENNHGIHLMSCERLCRDKKAGGLAFKQLREFNIALLGKIGWKLLKEPNSLVVRLLKARYFTNFTFLEAPLGNNPSYIWRSIRESQKIIRKGIYWKVGGGEQIAIWTEPWLRDAVNPFITTAFDPSFGVYYMRDLIVNGRWDLQLIREIFNARDAGLILSILLIAAVEEEIAWRFNEKGFYTVKLAYKALTQNADDIVPLPLKSVWNRLWKIKAPPQVINFIWRAANGILPTRDQLRRKRVDVPPYCLLCNQRDESALHLLVNYAISKQVWQCSFLGWYSPVVGSFKEWLGKIFGIFNDKDAAMTLIVCWQIWNTRNDVIWKHKFSSLMIIWLRAWRFLEDWLTANVATGRGVAAEVKWQCPRLGWVKINVDATGEVGGSCAGYGVVVRDDEATVLGLKIGRFRANFRTKEVEAMVVKEALSWLKGKGWSRVILESDNLLVVNALNDQQYNDVTIFGDIIRSIRQISSRVGCEVEFKHVYRSSNEVAHRLAQASRSVSNVGEWLHDFPFFVFPILRLDD